MRDNTSFNVESLPDIEMYGGDTLPWEVTLIRSDGSHFSVDTASECTATLTFTPLKASTGLGNSANALAPILTKVGEVREALSGGSIILFEFAEEDTKSLRGKFLYQIEVSHDDDLRLCQGHIYIKQNINR